MPTNFSRPTEENAVVYDIKCSTEALRTRIEISHNPGRETTLSLLKPEPFQYYGAS